VLQQFTLSHGRLRILKHGGNFGFNCLIHHPILIFLLADVEVIPQLIRLLQQNLVLLQPTPIAAWKNQLVP